MWNTTLGPQENSISDRLADKEYLESSDKSPDRRAIILNRNELTDCLDGYGALVICADEQTLERHASRRSEAEYCLLMEARFVGRDQFLNGLARCGIILMDKTQDIRRLANHFT